MAGWIGYHERTEDGDFTCQRCGWRGRARVTVTGRGRATLFFDKPEKALINARADSQYRVQRALRRARCHKCGERNPGQALWFWAPWVLGFCGGVYGGFYYLPMILYPAVLAIPYVAWRSWRKIDEEVEWLA